MGKPIVLIVMDGFGLKEDTHGNAIKQADTPNLGRYFAEWPFTTLSAYGEEVGLPEGFQGSSEVGHLNIGAGRLVKQEEVRIDKMIQSGEFFEKEELKEAIENVEENESNFHIMGLLSDKGVHAHIDHLFALMKFCHENDVEPYIHAFTDGRDTLPQVAEKYFQMLDEKLDRYGGDLKTVMGRYYAMDRDENWERTKLAYEAINEGEGEHVKSWKEALNRAYNSDETDEFIKPRVLDYEGLEEDDSVVFYNYRSDRPRQLTKALIEEDFDSFERDFKPVHFVGMVRYYNGMPAPYICEKPHPKMTLGEYFSNMGWRQYRIAENEKKAHVTYFFSGEREEPFEGEERIIKPSPNVATYDEIPEMSAYEITEECLGILDDADFVVMNFANCDMVGHTGDLEAAVEAVEAVDDCIGRIVDRVQELGGIALITADHGNAETMLTPEGDTVTSHTSTRVPFCIVGWQKDVGLKEGKLGDIAPTLLTVLDLDIPEEMTGDVLIGDNY